MTKEDKNSMYIAVGIVIFFITLTILFKSFFNNLNNRGCVNHYGKEYRYIFEDNRDYCINGVDKKPL